MEQIPESPSSFDRLGPRPILGRQILCTRALGSLKKLLLRWLQPCRPGMGIVSQLPAVV